MPKLTRTNSSPSLKDSARQQRESPYDVRHFFDPDHEDQEFYVIGDRVFVDGYRAASVAYFGEVDFAPGDWVGVVMDDPRGNHDGRVHGRQYFQCEPLHGLFVRPQRVKRYKEVGTRYGNGRLPLDYQQFRTHSAASSRPSYGVGSPTASSVITDSSYFYDEDYRQTRPATIAALGQRLSGLEASSRPQSRSSAATPPVGILKNSSHSPLSRQRQLEPRSRSETRHNSHADRAEETQDPKASVFNFRPRRDKLNRSQTSILSDASNKTTSVSLVDLSSEPLKVGDRVLVRSERGDLSGVLRFMGETNFATGEWAGIELDQAEGKNDGSILGFRYFHCPSKYGLFVPASRVWKHDGAPGFKTIRSTIKSPPPPPKATRIYDNISYTGSSSNNSRSMTPSSYQSSYQTTPSPANGEFLSSPSSKLDYLDLFSEFFSPQKSETQKFDDNDIEYQLKRSLQRNSLSRNPVIGFKDSQLEMMKHRPRCVKYTFSSSKYDGNPIARRTVEYG